MSTPIYKDITISNLQYSQEVSVNKKNNAKSIKVATSPGNFEYDKRLRFQMGQLGTEDILRAVYGVSTPLAGQDPTRRSLDLSIDSEDLLTFLNNLDANNKEMALKHSFDYFKKQVDPSTIESFYTPLVKPSTKDGYRPTVRTKMVIDSDRSNTQIFLVKNEKRQEDGTSTYDYEPGSISDVQKGAKVIAVVETGGLWLAQKMNFGMSLTVTHLLVWPTRSNMGIDAINFGPNQAKAFVSSEQPMPQINFGPEEDDMDM